jgi:hypothetical protein
MKSVLAAALAAFIGLPQATRAAGLDIGGFTVARGGAESLASTSETGLASAIAAAFPHSRIRYRSTLSRKFLETVSVVVIGVAQSSTGEITPLTAKEQAALLAFVKHGGTAILFCDNNLQFNPASNSLLAPFGLASDGNLSNAQTLAFTSGTNDPVETGPFGTAAQLDYSWTAWFTKLGPATALGTLGNGQPGLAWLPKGALDAASGAVVFFADSSLMVDGVRTAEDKVAILNAIALGQ